MLRQLHGAEKSGGAQGAGGFMRNDGTRFQLKARPAVLSQSGWL